MACNLPVVSVPCGDVAQRTRQTSPGEVCPYDPELLGAALVKVFGSASRSNGREQLEAQELTSAHVAEKLIKLYSIVQGSPEQVKTQLAMLCAA
jgi:glycosyltransferase involved in cell wall biosynthesis